EDVSFWRPYIFQDLQMSNLPYIEITLKEAAIITHIETVVPEDYGFKAIVSTPEISSLTTLITGGNAATEHTTAIKEIDYVDARTIRITPYRFSHYNEEYKVFEARLSEIRIKGFPIE
ncbi:MAG: hypothetical protein KDD62_15135, partial [Bdellovibrionales bacterium]|nr:hypothetical protein [Bdellovibrionales bacterium]